jgi:chemotaxis protein CheC
MCEVGNIILNACMGSIANIIDSEFDSTLPEVMLGLGNELLKVGESGGGETVMLIFIDFIIASKTIHGYMVFLMDVPSINGLIKSVDYFLNS